MAVERVGDRWRRDERTLSRSAPDLVVLLGPDGGDPIALRGTGVALWHALDQPQSTDELAILLAGEFDASPEAVRSDIDPLLAQLSGVVRAGP
jgi:Coenzyme PQQ synthesis protein D (PqqD)